MDAEESIAEVHAAIQWAIENWGRLLIATGGTLKPKKCFYHLIDFAWTQKGGWQYITHHEDEGTALFVPLPDGTMAPISHLTVDDALKTLGVITCPSGNSAGSLHQMKGKAKKCFFSLTAGQLHCRMMWFSVNRQMWPSVKYGLCYSMATLSELDSVVMPLYGKCYPLGGLLARPIKVSGSCFYGAGFPHPGVEATLEQANKLLMHYGCRTALGTELHTLLELLVVDLGLSFQPFQVSYEHFGDWVTTLLLKRVREKVSFFGFTLSVNNLLACYPREGDDWLMYRFIARGYTANELAILNRVQKHQPVLFLSDILGAGGGSVDKRYLHKRWTEERWSSMKFPREEVTVPEMELWCRAIAQVVSHGPAQASLGVFRVDGSNCGSGELWRIKAGCTGKMGIKSRCMDMFDGADTSIFAPVARAKCAVTWPRWRKACRVRRKSVPLHLLPSARSPPLIFWTFFAGGDKHGYGMTSRSQAAQTGLPKPLQTTV